MKDLIEMMMDLKTLERLKSLPLGHCQPQNRKLLKRFMKKMGGERPWNQKQVAEYIGMDEGRFSLIFSNKSGKFGKELEGRDVIKFIFKGVYPVEELGLNINNRDEALLKRLCEVVQRPGWIEAVFRCMDADVDLVEVVSPALNIAEKTKNTNIIKPISEENLPEKGSSERGSTE